MDEVDLSGAEQEDLRGKSAGTAGHGLSITGSLSVRDFHLLDGIPDIGLKQVQEGRIQVVVDGAVLVVVVVGAVPLSAFIAVLHQKPRSITARVVHGAGLPLVDNDEIFRSTIDLQLHGTADCLGAQSNRCHVGFPPFECRRFYSHGTMSSGLGAEKEATESSVALCVFL